VLDAVVLSANPKNSTKHVVIKAGALLLINTEVGKAGAAATVAGPGGGTLVGLGGGMLDGFGIGSVTGFVASLAVTSDFDKRFENYYDIHFGDSDEK
jgi:hypothetical protein